MVRLSAGVLPFRDRDGRIEVLIAHPGGPFWVRKDNGSWSVIKGEYADGEEPLDAARREFREETGLEPPVGTYIDLGSVKQSGGKVVTVFAVAADEFDVTGSVSNEFETEWPPRSGRTQFFPEVDRIEWFSLDDARVKLLKSQVAFLDRVVTRPCS